MKKTLFVKSVPLELLLNLLDKVCSAQYEYYIVDKTVHRKILYFNYHLTFKNQILPYYHKSKQYFVTREFTYNSFVNIIRQICGFHSHSFVAKKQYDHSEYTIRYIISK